ncbi:class II histone deacetylase [Acinetobacter baumannii]|uniref:class II histone deacetylase n=1 Tax=Acinetobacter baumannii TaxID=470 RepID=UPI003D046D2F
MQEMKKIGYVWDTLYSWVDTGTGGVFAANLSKRIQPITHHMNHPDTKRRFNELVMTSGQIDFLTPIKPYPATDADILRVHDKQLLDNAKNVSNKECGGDIGDRVTHLGNGGIEIAYLSAGGAIELTKKVISGELHTGYALVSPPGHHATKKDSMGFCIFNNTSIAAAYAKDILGLKRVAIVDWDVHHGNGTQDIWWEDSSVLTISIHQNKCFPTNSGFINERGAGNGFGYNLNIPLPPGSGNGAYIYAFEKVIVPALKKYEPELIIVGSGFDASILDPLSRMMVSSEGFKKMASLILDVSNEISDGKCLFVQEGGYSPHYLPFCGLAVIEALTGVPTLDDPLIDMVGEMGGNELLPHEKKVVDECANLIADIN